MGIGVEKSDEKSMFYRKKKFLCDKTKADEGDPECQAWVGWAFEKGEGVAQSLESAVHYYQLSGDQNCAKGLFHLGACFATGKGKLFIIIHKLPIKGIFQHNFPYFATYTIYQK